MASDSVISEHAFDESNTLEELRRRERELADFIENASVGLHWVGADGTILWANQAELDMLGYTREEYIGRSITEFHADSDVINDILCRLTNKETLHNYEARLRCKDGSIRHVLINSNVMWEEDKFVHTRCFTRDITERVEAEARLRESEARFAKAFNSSPLVLTISSLKTGKLLEVNDTFVNVTGFTREEAIGLTTVELGLWAKPQDREEEMETVRQLGQVRNAEYIFRMRDGSEIVGLLSAEEIEIGGEAFTLTVIQDITKRKRTEEELHKSKRQLEELLTREQYARAAAEQQRDFTRLVLEDAPMAIGVMEGPDHRFVLVNRVTCEITGLSEDQFLGRTHREVVPEADKVVAPILDRVYATGISETDEIEVDLPTGRRQLLVTWTVLPGQDSRPGSVLYLSLDITDRKQMEERLRESEIQLRTLADAVPQLVWMAEPDGHIFWYNQRWYDYTGTSPEQMAGWGWQSVHDPEMLPQVVNRWRASLETGEPFEMEFPLKGADGVFRWFLTRVNPLRDSQRRIVRWFGTNTDVDEQRRTAEELREANRLKDEFLATISHELRTPLTAILGWAHLLRRGQLDEKRAASALETIERNARAQSQLIDDLLDVSRIITGKLRLDVRQIEPGSFIESAIEALRPAAEAKEVRIQKVMDTGVVSVAGDPTRLQQVIWNLLSNAIKFTPKGGRVQIRLERINSHIEIAVSDTGVGIKPEFLPHVFERFRQADQTTTRQHGGLGLGLAIVRHLVELHGGTVHAESQGEGQGATFIVKLPVVPVYQKDNSTERVHPAARDTLPSYDCPERFEGLKVLVIDDEADTRELLRVGISQCGAKVLTATSAQEALEAIEEERPDLLVSDIGMAGEDGYELIRKVRALPAGHGGKIPAIALTAYARTEDRLRALRAGYQMHIPKPVELAELMAVMASLIQRNDNVE